MEQQTEREQLVANAVTLFTEDTVFAGVQLMQQHGLTALSVVEGSTGEWVGEVSSEELVRWWKTSPFARISEVLTVRASGGAVVEERPRITLVSPLMDVLRVSRKWVQ